MFSFRIKNSDSLTVAVPRQALILTIKLIKLLMTDQY
jgi:hypothetical protein